MVGSAGNEVTNMALPCHRRCFRVGKSESSAHFSPKKKYGRKFCTFAQLDDTETQLYRIHNHN